MQYILTEQEFQNLKTIGAKATHSAQISLQSVCSEYANFYFKTTSGSCFKDKIACKNGDPFVYCTDCPSLTYCPSTSKEYPK